MTDQEQIPSFCAPLAVPEGPICQPTITGAWLYTYVEPLLSRQLLLPCHYYNFMAALDLPDRSPEERLLGAIVRMQQARAFELQAAPGAKRTRLSPASRDLLLATEVSALPAGSVPLGGAGWRGGCGVASAQSPPPETRPLAPCPLLSLGST